MKISATAAVLALLRAARSAEGGVVAAPADAAEPVANAGGLRGTDGAVDAPGPGAAESATPRGRRGRRELSTETTFDNIGMINVPALPDAHLPVKICLVCSGMGMLNRATGRSFVEGSDWWIDAEGQGTHIAGIIGAIIPDPYKYLLHVVKVSPTLTAEEAWHAVYQCIVDNGARIISFSSSVSAFSSSDTTDDGQLEEILQRAYDQGVLIIAPAGNDGSNTYPGMFRTVISVASVGEGGSHSDSSNDHAQVELAAPGENIYSSSTDATKSGTEYAAAHVAGVAALLMWRFPDCTNNQIRNAMLRSASEPECYDQDRTAGGWDLYFGRGIVDAGAALKLLQREGCAGAGGPDPDAGEALSNQTRGGEWQGCGKRDKGKCDRNNDEFLPCCQGISCAILAEHEEGWCGCVPEGQVCSLKGGSELTCCPGSQCATPNGKGGVKVCQ